MEIKTLQPAMGELERILKWSSKTTGIGQDRVVPTIQTRGKKARCGGWFAPDRWSTREGDLCHEIKQLGLIEICKMISVRISFGPFLSIPTVHAIL